MIEDADGFVQILRLMDAADVSHEIEILPKEERGKVIDFVQHLAQQQFEEEQIRIADKRLEDYYKGLEKAIPYEEAMLLLREG